MEHCTCGAEKGSGRAAFRLAHTIKGSQDGSCWLEPPTYLLLAGLVTMGAGRWAGEEAAEVTPIVSPDTRVTWAVTTENLENIIITESSTCPGVTQANREVYSL